MSLITGSIKSILSVNIKHRHDSCTDQVSRVFMFKLFLAASLIIGVDWFHDTVFCTMPMDSPMSDDFVQSACWIQGFYIYPQLDQFMKQSAYYGIPKAITLDGIYNGTDGHQELCPTKTHFYEDMIDCVPMHKHYFAYFQWMPFYIASLSLLFYLPYVFFLVTNSDIISLRTNLKQREIFTKDIVENYFNRRINSRMKMRLTVVFNVAIKCMYIFVNIFTFKVLDILLGGNYASYGLDWAKWLALNSSQAMDFSKRTAPTPGNRMLPTFGFCDIHEMAKDSRSNTENKNKLLCEVSSHVLYQYVLMVIWFALIISITVSILGLFINIATHLVAAACMVKRGERSRYVYRHLTLRECEYLDYIRHKNLAVFGNVVRALIAKNSILKNMLPSHAAMNTKFMERSAPPCDTTDAVNFDSVINLKVPEDDPVKDIDCDPGELSYFRKTDHQMSKMSFKDRVKTEKKYELLDDLLSGGL